MADPGFTNEGQGRAAARTEVERPRREDLGADGVGVARGVPWDWEGAGMPARKKIEFGSQNGNFRCILD